MRAPVNDVEAIYQGILAGKKRAIARGLSWIDSGGERGNTLASKLFLHAGRAHIVGITGAPGVGKSTLVNALTLQLRREGHTVGILAVDPSSPFTGGAILGDRIRMQDCVDDPGVYMRSLASRGYVGGLSRAVFGATTLLDAAGFDVVLIETVGAGQAEVDIMRYAQSVMVVMAPGMGDDIQAIKAGILEIGNVFVVNKADREGADSTARSLRAMMSLAAVQDLWVPPILKTVADSARGIGDLTKAVAQHRQYLVDNALWQQWRARQAENLLQQALQDAASEIAADAKMVPRWHEAVEQVQQGEDVPRLARQLMADWLVDVPKRGG